MSKLYVKTDQSTGQCLRTSPLVCLIPEMFHGVIDLLHLQTMIFHNGTGKSLGRDGK